MGTKEPDAAQSERFKAAARELGCDEDEAAFDAQSTALARHKPVGGAGEPQPEPVKPPKAGGVP